MPNWAGGILTAKGRKLQAKVEAGAVLELTKMKLGSGTPASEEIDNLTDLKTPKYVMGISSKEALNNICKVTGIILSTQITEGFYAREMGLFANDPDEGEILYMVTTDTNPDFVPPSTAAIAVSASYALNIAALNADDVSVIIDPAGLVTVNMLEAHNTNENAHSELLKKYLPLAGGTTSGLIQLATDLITNLATNIPPTDNSGDTIFILQSWLQQI